MPEPTSIARVVLVALLVTWFVLEVRQSRRSRPEARHADRGSVWVLRVTTVLGFLGAGAVAVLAPGATVPAPVAAWGPVLLVAAGAALRLWSARTLGRWFTFTVQVSPEQPVIDVGPYRFVRHPAYLGMVVALTGVALLLGNWLALIVFEVCTVAGMAYRIRVEERALAAELGPRWTSYAARTRRLVPYVW